MREEFIQIINQLSKEDREKLINQVKKFLQASEPEIVHQD